MEYTISEESLEKLYKQNDEQAARIATLEAENARLTAANESMQEDAVQNTYAFGLMLKANKEQASYIEWANAKIKELEDLK